MDKLLCPTCGQANRPLARFCWSCGAALARSCPRCGAANRLSARYCVHCGVWLELTVAMQQNAQGGMVAGSALSEPSAPPSSAPLRLLEAETYSGFGRLQSRSVSQPSRRFGPTDTAFHIRLRLANLDPMRSHSHRLLVQFFRPNGRLHLSRERPELVVAPAGQPEVETSIFGLRISGTEVLNHPGIWRAVVYLDEEKLVEIPFEIVG